MNINLATFADKPQLIEGKIVVLNNGYSSSYYPSSNTHIKENFNPIHYSILNHPKYRPCIVYASSSEINDVIFDCLENTKKHRNININIGQRIHLQSRQGIYTVVSFDATTITLTCNKWRYDNRTIKVFKSDFKCLAGGYFNY